MEGALTATLIQVLCFLNARPPDGMSAAAESRDFGTSRRAALLSGYLSLASKRKGQRPLLLLLAALYATALITRATFSTISPIWASLTIKGGVSAMVSPVTRIIRLSRSKACTMAS